MKYLIFLRVYLVYLWRTHLPLFSSSSCWSDGTNLCQGPSSFKPNSPYVSRRRLVEFFTVNLNPLVINTMIRILYIIIKFWWWSIVIRILQVQKRSGPNLSTPLKLLFKCFLSQKGIMIFFFIFQRHRWNFGNVNRIWIELFQNCSSGKVFHNM